MFVLHRFFSSVIINFPAKFTLNTSEHWTNETCYTPSFLLPMLQLLLLLFLKWLAFVNKLHVTFSPAFHFDLIRFLAKNINHKHSRLKYFIELQERERAINWFPLVPSSLLILHSTYRKCSCSIDVLVWWHDEVNVESKSNRNSSSDWSEWADDVNIFKWNENRKMQRLLECWCLQAKPKRVLCAWCAETMFNVEVLLTLIYSSECSCINLCQNQKVFSPRASLQLKTLPKHNSPTVYLLAVR